LKLLAARQTAAGGIGSTIARRISDEGGTVVLCDLDQGRVDAVASELEARTLAVAADVRDEHRMTEVGIEPSRRSDHSM
jgi:NADP-dependent 3-hydroxy acid dehydrogenase YdfG